MPKSTWERREIRSQCWTTDNIKVFQRIGIFARYLSNKDPESNEPTYVWRPHVESFVSNQKQMSSNFTFQAENSLDSDNGSINAREM